MTDAPVRVSAVASVAVSTLAVGAIALFVAWPAGQVLWRGIGVGVMGEVLGDARLRRIVWHTVAQAIASTSLALVIGVITGAVLGTWDFRGRRVLTALIASPFALPSVVVGASFLSLLPERLERGWAVVVAAHVFYNVGMIARSVGDAWAACDPRLDDAAATLGAAPARVIATVVLPQLAPLLWRLAGLVGALSVGTFGIVLVLGGPFRPTTEVEVWRQAVQLFRLDRAAALAIIQFVVVGAWLWFTARTASRGSLRQRSTDRRRPADRSFALVGVPLLALISALIIMPVAALVTRSLREPGGSRGWENFTRLDDVVAGSGLNEAPLRSVMVSLRVGAMAAAGAVVVATALASALPHLGARRRIVETLASLPLAVSSVALGLGFLLGFASPPVAWRSAWWLMAVVQAVVALPFAVRVIVSAVDRIDPAWRDAAATLGASPWRRWWTVDRVLLQPAIGAGAAIAGAIALGELGASSFLARPESTTMPIAIARLSGRPGEALLGQANALAVILGALTIALTLLSQRRPAWQR